MPTSRTRKVPVVGVLLAALVITIIGCSLWQSFTRQQAAAKANQSNPPMNADPSVARGPNDIVSCRTGAHARPRR